MKKTNTLGVFATLLLTPFFAFSQIAAWQFSNPASSGSEATYQATTLNGDLSHATLSRGAGIAASGWARGFAATNWDGSNQSGAITNNEYFQVVLEADAGYTVSLSTLDARLRRSGTGPNTYIWRYSVDGSTFHDIGSSITGSATDAGNDQAQINLSSINDLQSVSNGTTITLRLYAWGASGSGGVFAFGRYAANNTTNSIAIGGTVAVAGPVTTEVNFATASSSADEDDGSINLVLNITNPSSTNGTSVDVVLTSGDAARVNGFTSQTVTWSANDGSSKNVSITITDNSECDGDEPLTFELQDVSGGDDAAIGSGDTHVLTVVNDDHGPTDAPVATAGTAVGSDSFTANWGAVTGATGYYLDVSTSPTFGSATPGSTTTETFTVIGGGQANSYLTRTWTGDDGVAWTAYKARTDQEVFAADPAIALQNASGAYMQSGTIADGVQAISFDVKQVFTGSGGILTVKVLSGAGFGTTTTIGTIGYTTTASEFNEVFTPITGPIQIVVENNASARPAIDNLSFTRASIFAPSFVPGYENMAVAGTSQGVSGLDPETTYYYRVRAVSSCGESDNSNTVSVTTLANATEYYSRGSGSVADPIWSSTPTGTAGPAVFNGNVSMVVQDGDNVTATASVVIKDFTVEDGASFSLNSGTSLAVHGEAMNVEGTFNAGDNTSLILAGADGVILESTDPLNLYNLEVNTPNGALTDAVINIRGTLQLTDGEFESLEPVTLISNASGTARLGAVGPDADFIGELTMQRFIPAGHTNWRMLGSAVAGQTVADWKDDFYTAGFPGSHYPSFDSPWGSGHIWPSIRWYDETVGSNDAQEGVTGVSGVAQPLAMGQGFIAWSGDALETTSAFTISVTGEPHIAKTPLALPMSWTDSGNASADGWNLVSNPLPSAITFTQISRGADVQNAYWVFDPVAGTNRAWSDGVGQGGANGTIQSSQGFWLKANGEDLTTTMHEGAKVNTLTGGLFGGAEQPLLPILALEIASNINAYSDEATIVFANGSPAYDGNDAPKMTFKTDGAPQLAVRSTDGKDLAIDFFGSYNEAIEIPLNVGVDVTGTYTITAALSGINTLGCLTLVDQLTGAVTPLTDGASYTFSITAGDAANASRFVINGTKPLPLFVDNALCHGLNGSGGVVSNEGPINLVWTDAFGNALLTQGAENSSGDYFEFQAPAGQYMVYLSPAGECGQVSASFTITEPAELEVAATVEATSCPASDDGSVELSVSGGTAPYTYSWSNGSEGEALEVAAGEYTILVTDAHGCVLPVLAIVPAGEGTIAGFALNGEAVAGVSMSFNNTSILADQYFWDFGDGSTSTEESPVHTWATPGDYNVSLTASSEDCTDTFTMDVNVGIGTGISEAHGNNLRVWATPGHIVIEHPFGSAPVNVDVFDATGRLAIGQNNLTQPERIQLSDRSLGDGVWFVRVTSGDAQRTFRVPLVR